MSDLMSKLKDYVNYERASGWFRIRLHFPLYLVLLENGKEAVDMMQEVGERSIDA